VAQSTHILLVDDDEELRGFVREILTGRGYEVSEAQDYDSAIRQLQHRVFHLILLDITLPGKSGIDILEFIHRNHIGAPVIMVTGTSGLDLAIRSMSLGAKDYITKPCSPNYLLHSIEHALASQPA
jgi:DNA-binding NtrC family response regulator